MPLTLVLLLTTFVLICTIVDVRERRIPNLLSGSAILIGTLLHAAYFGRAGVAENLTGLAVGRTLFLNPFALGGVGAGDVKMMGAVGALVGPRLVLVSGL